MVLTWKMELIITALLLALDIISLYISVLNVNLSKSFNGFSKFENEMDKGRKSNLNGEGKNFLPAAISN